MKSLLSFSIWLFRAFLWLGYDSLTPIYVIMTTFSFKIQTCLKMSIKSPQEIRSPSIRCLSQTRTFRQQTFSRYRFPTQKTTWRSGQIPYPDSGNCFTRKTVSHWSGLDSALHRIRNRRRRFLTKWMNFLRCENQ